jgi:hypothetical protein
MKKCDLGEDPRIHNREDGAPVGLKVCCNYRLVLWCLNSSTESWRDLLC